MNQAGTLNYAPPVTASTSSRPWLFRFALTLSGLTFLLIIAGGNVTSKNAGLAVPDWPLSFGSVNPPGWTSNMDGTLPGVRDEHGHRLVGATVGMMVIGLVVWLKLTESRTWVRRLGYVALAAVIVQGIMGGLRVTERSIALAIVHGCFGQLFFCLTLAIALSVSPRFPGGRPFAGAHPAADKALRVWTAGLVLAVLLQLILGALLRHLGGGHAAVTHIAGALMVGAVLVVASQQIFSRPESEGPLAAPIIVLFLLYGLQLVLGAVAYMLVVPMPDQNPVTTMQAYLPTVHVAVGALILGVSFLVAFRAYALTSSTSNSLSRAEGGAL